MNDEATKCMVNSPEGVEAFSFLVDLALKDKVMYQMRNGRFVQRPQVSYSRPKGRRKTTRVRRSLVWVPIAVVVCAYIVTNILVAFSFNDVARWLGVVDVDRYRRLAIWGTVLTAIVAVARILKTRAKQGE